MRRKKSCFVFFEEALKLRLVTAKLFLATRAIKTLVGHRRETFRVHSVGNFPSQKQCKRTSQQAIVVQTWHKHKRRKHHGKIPIVDTAGRAASILHDPSLEGTEIQNTNDIANRIGDRD